jgi:hypothetical protein
MNEVQPITFVYFTCGPHFEYFRRSLLSLWRVTRGKWPKTIAYVDPENPFSTEQIAALATSFPKLIIRKAPGHITGYGKLSINTEITCFSEVSADCAEDSYIAKVDSDVIFISGKFISEVTSSGGAIAGELVRHFQPLSYMQGGAYFLSVKYASKLREVDDAFCQTIVDQMNLSLAKRGVDRREGAAGEDAGISCQVTHVLGGQAVGLPRYRQSILHFVGKKDEMFRYDKYWRFLLSYKYTPIARIILKALIGRAR